jgi:hypothetical protein
MTPAARHKSDLPPASAWADAFQTFDWQKALPVPDLVVKQIGQLLALVHVASKRQLDHSLLCLPAPTTREITEHDLKAA